MRTFASTVLFTQFPLCRTLAAVFHCITVYKQPPPSLHRQHYRASDIYIILMLELYNCTEICIVKPRQSIAFGNIYIGGHFLGSREGEKRQKTSECRTSRRLSSLWTSRCVHWMSKSALSALLPRTRDRSDVILENAPVSFAACPVTIFAALPRTIDRSNAKLGEGVKHLI